MVTVVPNAVAEVFSQPVFATKGVSNASEYVSKFRRPPTGSMLYVGRDARVDWVAWLPGS